MKPDLEELRRLLADATPGPWHDSATGYSVRGGDDGAIICDMRCADVTTDKMVANQELIAAMRNALPALLDGYEAGRKLREAMNDADSWGDAQRAAAEFDAAVGVE